MNISPVNIIGDVNNLIPDRTGILKPPGGLSPGEGHQKFNPIKEAFKNVNHMQIKAAESAERFSVGDTDSIHKVVIDMEEAFLSLKLAVQVRNKAVEAYQEIMRMQM